MDTDIGLTMCSATAPAPPETVPYARFLASQKTVEALLTERACVMGLLFDLVNATTHMRHVSVTLAGEPNVGRAWAAAHAVCVRWLQATSGSLGGPPGSFEPANGAAGGPLAEQK